MNTPGFVLQITVTNATALIPQIPSTPNIFTKRVPKPKAIANLAIVRAPHLLRTVPNVLTLIPAPVANKMSPATVNVPVLYIAVVIPPKEVSKSGKMVLINATVNIGKSNDPPGIFLKIP